MRIASGFIRAIDIKPGFLIIVRIVPIASCLRIDSGDQGDYIWKRFKKVSDDRDHPDRH